MRRSLLPAAAAVAAVVAVLAIAGALPDLNPFRTESVDRSQPAVLKSIARLQQFRAATANLQVVVDLERDTRHVPDFLKGQRTLFIAAGTVDAGVDFSGLRDGAVRVNGDRTAATITLPAARLYDARVDPRRSRVIARERGLLDRIGGVFRDSPTDDQQLLVLADEKLVAAARADPQLLRTAERNTRGMLEGLLRGLGFTRVIVRFERPPPV